jgi:hypothetical protein
LMQSLDMEKEEHVKYWKNVVSLLHMRMQDELAATGAVARTGETAGIEQPHVTSLVEEALQGTTQELEELEDELHAELNNPQCADPEFWRAVHAKCATALPYSDFFDLYRETAFYRSCAVREKCLLFTHFA